MLLKKAIPHITVRKRNSNLNRPDLSSQALKYNGRINKR